MGVIGRVRREYVQATSLLRTLRRIRGLTPDGEYTLADMIEAVVDQHHKSVAFLFEDAVWSYDDYERLANRYARWALEQGVRKGDVVALLMENRPEYLAAWFGLVKIGAVAALINTNLRGGPLAHSLNVSGADLVILGAELTDEFDTARGDLQTELSVWVTGRKPGRRYVDLDADLTGRSPDRPPRDVRRGLKTGDKALYIYTSGTTGNPKAARISHLRALVMMNGFSAAANATWRDRMYLTLPLYHSAGGVAAVGVTLTVGGSLIIKQKFSATEFWNDAVKYRATIFQYIGELCRYLLNAPKNRKERRHRIRVCIGNGLRPDIWAAFQKRFRIPKIVEFYGATEGNVALFNYDGTVGAIGRIPRYLARQFDIKIVRFDLDSEQPVRGADGFCIECAPDEVGEAVGAISNDRGKPQGRFEGYTNPADTEKKVLRDAFKKGDSYFRTGDLMRRDARGYFFFVDRIGDTFRWKGENVATSEVAEVISVFPRIKEVNVYGVEVPGADGRAGMAAITAGKGLDMAKLHAHIAQNLPGYARPLFLRIQDEIETTGTFKHRKVDLAADGFDPSRVRDPIFFDHPERGAYVSVDAALYRKITSGDVRI
jgi:fatty-acyl-CoA synthase